MAAMLASFSCGCCVDLTYQGRQANNDLSFSGSVSYNDFPTSDKDVYNLVKTRFKVGMQGTDLSAKVGTNGRPIKMVPATEVRKQKSPSEVVNGSAKNVNGRSLVKRDPASPLSKASKTTELPPIEGVKVLPSDEGFSWANENYNSIQRSIDVWSFVLSLRVRILLDNAKWTYVGGFSEDKQVCTVGLTS